MKIHSTCLLWPWPLNGLYGVHKVISIRVLCDLDLWPWKSIGNILSSWTICVPGLMKIHSTCLLWPWPLTLKINMDHPLIMTKVCGKFDKDTWNAAVSIVFTRSRCDGHTDAHTEPRKRYYIPVATRCAGIINIVSTLHHFLNVCTVAFYSANVRIVVTCPGVWIYRPLWYTSILRNACGHIVASAKTKTD